ncbi:MAG: globin family protein [Cyanobacteria bacterium P01_D01_bin.1]
MDVALLEKSFRQISPQAIEFSASFYRNLFRFYPELKALFTKTSQEAQERKLIFSLAIIVDNLRNLDRLQSALRSLGARHVQVGTLKSHYPLLGKALLETLAEYLGADWTQTLAIAWTEAYDAITTTMIEGANDPETYLEPEFTFYDWINAYRAESPRVRNTADTLNNVHHAQPARSIS